MPSYLYGDPERDLEQELKASLTEGDFLQCEMIVEDLEKLADKDIADNIEIGIILEVPKPEVHLGRGTSLSVVLHNHSVFPIELMSLVCSSAQAGISVLHFFKGEMPPENDRMFDINVIPKVEGDIAVHIEAVTRSSNRLVPVKKAFSLRVVPPVIAQVVAMPQAAPTNSLKGRSHLQLCQCHHRHLRSSTRWDWSKKEGWTIGSIASPPMPRAAPRWTSTASFRTTPST